MTLDPRAIEPVKGPRWTRARLIAMLLECYGPTPRGTVDVALVAHYAQVSTRTVRRWISADPAGSRRAMIPDSRLTQLQRGPAEVERRNEQQYTHALSALESISNDAAILPAWRKQGWLDPHTVAIIAIHNRPWHQIAVTNGTRRALRELHRRGATVDHLTVPTRFDAWILMHAAMTRQAAWRVHPAAHLLQVGRTQVWMADAPPVDLHGLGSRLAR